MELSRQLTETSSKNNTKKNAEQCNSEGNFLEPIAHTNSNNDPKLRSTHTTSNRFFFAHHILHYNCTHQALICTITSHTFSFLHV